MGAPYQGYVGVDLLESNYVFVYVTLEGEHTNAGHFQLPTTLSETHFQRLGLGAAHCFAQAR